MGRLDREYKLPEIAHSNSLGQRHNRNSLGSPSPDVDFGKFILFLEDDLRLKPTYVIDESRDVAWRTYFDPRVGIKVFRGDAAEIAFGAAFHHSKAGENGEIKYRNMLLWAAPLPGDPAELSKPVIAADRFKEDVKKISRYFVDQDHYLDVWGEDNATSIALRSGAAFGGLIGISAGLWFGETKLLAGTGGVVFGVLAGGAIGGAIDAGTERWKEHKVPRLDQYAGDKQAAGILEHIQGQVQRVTVQTEFDQAWASQSKVELGRDEVLRLYDRVAERTQGELFKRRLEEIAVSRHPERYGDIFIEMGAIDAMVAIAGDITNQRADIWEAEERSRKSTAATMRRVRRNTIIVIE